MAYGIFWTPVAVQDLRDICDFISRDNPVAAQRMGEELIKQAETMALFPQSGRMVPEKTNPLIRETISQGKEKRFVGAFDETIGHATTKIRSYGKTASFAGVHAAPRRGGYPRRLERNRND